MSSVRSSAKTSGLHCTLGGMDVKRSNTQDTAERHSIARHGMCVAGSKQWQSRTFARFLKYSCVFWSTCAACDAGLHCGILCTFGSVQYITVKAALLQFSLHACTEVLIAPSAVQHTPGCKDCESYDHGVCEWIRVTNLACNHANVPILWHGIYCFVVAVSEGLKIQQQYIHRVYIRTSVFMWCCNACNIRDPTKVCRRKGVTVPVSFSAHVDVTCLVFGPWLTIT